MSQSAYEAILAHARTTQALGQALEVLHWDQETMMPKRGGEGRAEQCAAIEAMIHKQSTDPRLRDLLEQVESPASDPLVEANLREIKRQVKRASRVPESLVTEMARHSAKAQGIWIEARKNDRFVDFAPTLEKMVSLKQQEADCHLQDFDNRYDALLDEYEPHAKGAWIADIFSQLRPELSALLQSLQPKLPKRPEQGGPFPHDAQIRLSREIAEDMGYDWNAGRLDLAVHPFSSGSHGDVRITTRVDEQDFLNCLYSTLHEVGHALYEQGVSRDLWPYPCGGSVSMGVHESQSRLWENQVARSKPFLKWLFPKLQRNLPNFGPKSVDELETLVNYPKAGFIRTESDEVSYNLHVILRFDLERQLISGDINANDIEAAWNERIKKDFELEVPKASLGVLQDVHWSCGYIGYFPTYTLGNIYAGELWAAMRKAHPGIDNELEHGNLEVVLTWLRENVHRHGKTYLATELIEKACGHKPSHTALVDYLKEKYGRLYKL